jgi:hypothetical protein
MEKMNSNAGFRNHAKILRLGMLAILAGGLTVPAFAASTCVHGQQYTLSGCPDGTTGYAECDCGGWSQSGGYTDCYIVAGCY